MSDQTTTTTGPARPSSAVTGVTGTFDKADASAGIGKTRGTSGGGRAMYPLGWLRGVAALMVVVVHAYMWNRTGPFKTWPYDGIPHQLMYGVDMFVDMFFVLSGFVMWLPLAAAALSGRQGRSGALTLAKRLARILPLYFLLTIIVWAWSNPELPGHWQDLLLHLTFTHVYSDTYIFWTNGPAWTLAVEFHFYVLIALLTPFLHRAAVRATTRDERLALALGVPVLLIVVGITYIAYVTQVARPDWTNWSMIFSPIGKAADFGIGMVLAVCTVAGIRLSRPARAACAIVGVAAVLALVLERPIDTLEQEWWHPAYALAVAVFMASIVLHDGPWPRALSWGPLAWLGGLGYGIYLIHEPVMRWVASMGILGDPRPGHWFWITSILVAIPTIFLAWVSSRTVELIGVQMLATVDKRGKARNYYPHLPDEAPQRRSRREGDRSGRPERPGDADAADAGDAEQAPSETRRLRPVAARESAA
ncbi:acyltransferase [Nocardioides zeae]|uniref:Acyltransferase n=1 Tax=Nocardioides imazamoxiresistens TaxID=3231893 RepID=A0ABU3PWB8_9ACTN|nr:acyltransferase [Nocardioides zeae]MDT9593181.1 acyltransferase [Nocardioides zeae]